MRPRIWQSITAGLAVACLTLTATAQLDTEREQDRSTPSAEERAGAQTSPEAREGRPSAEERLGTDRSAAERRASQRASDRGDSAATSQQPKLGTVDLKKVSEAYKKSQEQQASSGDSDLQTPAQADPPRPLGQSQDSGIDQQMLSQIRQDARAVAQEEGVDMIVLEVLHEGSANVQTVDLTDRVIKRIKGEDKQSESPLNRQSGQSGQSDENADAQEEADGLDMGR